MEESTQPELSPEVNMQPASALLNLSADLYLCILDLLPLESQATLVLTCRVLYREYGRSTLARLRTQCPNSRYARAHFLRLLRKDLDPALFTCYQCLAFHSPAKLFAPLIEEGNRYLPPDSRRNTPTEWRAPYTLPQSGFPYCKSLHTQILYEVQLRTENSQDRGSSYFDGACFVNGHRLNYRACIDVSNLGLYVSTNYTLDSLWYGEPSSLHNSTAYALRHANLEFCPHAWLGEDFVAGDGSLSDIVGVFDDTWQRGQRVVFGNNQAQFVDRVLDFKCGECGINIKIERGGRITSLARINTWKSFGGANKREVECRPARVHRVERMPNGCGVILPPLIPLGRRQRLVKWASRLLS
ncbi:hypothetical protein BS50DRAFT_397989 [Corynespora cassiicola Philippines]|uniref:F-box domain-containing protein n=1 Tax=Corynespora cassiicola Philippines TaxID=1448308 RepID=A0A2T2NKC1_CORCC|nr:hypothetical protein BS50DRAFT_397989 [Corynespora cassiicola Philippines]